MSIKGIDSQIMVARTTDYSKESSVQQRRNDLVQDYLSVQAKQEEAHEQKMVIKTQGDEMVRLHPDDSKGSGGSGGTRHGSGEKKKDDDEPGPGNAVPAEINIIDIKI